MEARELRTDIANGIIALINDDKAIAQLAWNAHPKFPGVFLKHIIQGAASDGKLSCHLVRVNPGCALETHIHENQWELHQVVAGDGHCLLIERRIPYNPGCLALIPQGASHRVEAGAKCLLLLATFFPALL
jgi:oxalate decarboxylase/phosphoglucose isomerase-like protein (cupin superfamily)